MEKEQTSFKDENVSAFAFNLAKIIEVEVDKRQKTTKVLEAKILYYGMQLRILAVSLQDERSKIASQSFNEYFGIVAAKEENIGK